MQNLKSEVGNFKFYIEFANQFGGTSETEIARFTFKMFFMHMLACFCH